MSEDHGFAMLMGLLYLIGGCLLVPGFLMIIPESVTSFPVVNHTTGVVEKVVTFPNFDHYEYAVGIDLLLVGVGLILVGAVIDFCLNFCLKVKPVRGTATSTMADPMLPAAPEEATQKSLFWRSASPLCQVLGASFLLAGCIVFMPVYALGAPPATILGVSAPKLGNWCFQVASVLYCVGALLAIASIVSDLRSARKAGRVTTTYWISLCAFVLFIATSVLFFVNGRLPTAQAVTAGSLRLAASICLLCAIVLLFVVSIIEARARRTLVKPINP